jgi:hypothetical protein
MLVQFVLPEEYRLLSCDFGTKADLSHKRPTSGYDDRDWTSVKNQNVVHTYNKDNWHGDLHL